MRRIWLSGCLAVWRCLGLCLLVLLVALRRPASGCRSTALDVSGTTSSPIRLCSAQVPLSLFPPSPPPPQAHGNSNPLRLLCLSCLSLFFRPHSPNHHPRPFPFSSPTSCRPVTEAISFPRRLFVQRAGGFSFFSFLFRFSIQLGNPGSRPSRNLSQAIRPRVSPHIHCFTIAISASRPSSSTFFFLDDVDDTSIFFSERPIDTRSTSHH